MGGMGGGGMMSVPLNAPQDSPVPVDALSQKKSR
jgi:hypothetical protein